MSDMLEVVSVAGSRQYFVHRVAVKFELRSLLAVRWKVERSSSAVYASPARVSAHGRA